jgi:hypothetical protein
VGMRARTWGDEPARVADATTSSASFAIA